MYQEIHNRYQKTIAKQFILGASQVKSCIAIVALQKLNTKLGPARYLGWWMKDRICLNISHL